VERLGDIGVFKILAESSVSSGVRRIEAITGDAVVEYTQQMEATLFSLAEKLKASVKAVPDRLEALIEERKKLERELKTARSSSAVGQEESVETINGVSLLVYHAKDLSGSDTKPLMDTLKQKIGSGIVLLTTVSEDKATALIGVTSDLLSQYNAKDLILPVVQALGGNGGGGRPDLAQGGGKATHLEAAVTALKHSL
jgi:alanyl-tRNA synthetase